MKLGLELLAVPNRPGRKGIGQSGNKTLIPMTMYGMKAEDIDSDEYRDALREKYARLRQMKAHDGNTHDVLRDYQVADVDFILNVDHPLVANEMRLGKTLTTCFALKELNMKTLVVAPASVLFQWQEECHKAGLIAVICAGTPKKREAAYMSEVDVVIVSYESMRNDMVLIKQAGFEVLVADEVHRIGNHKTKAHKVLVDIGAQMYKRIGLTGTPIYGKADRLYGVLRFIYPNFFRSYWGFVERYLNVIEGYWGNEIAGFSPARRPELEEMMANFMIQRKQVDHMEWLQKPSEYRINVPLVGKRKKEYKELYETMELEEREWDAQSPVVLLGMLGKLTLEAKLDMLEDILVEPEPTIIFLTRSSYIPAIKDVLAKLNYPSFELHGKLSAEDKMLNVQAFQHSSMDNRVIICNIKSAGTGVTLSTASRTIFLEESWVPEENQQAAQRMTGGEGAKAIYHLHVPDSVDDYVRDVVTGKKTHNDVINEMRRKFE